MMINLRKVDLVLADIPAKLRAIADQLKVGMGGEAGMTSMKQWRAAEQLESYAADIEHFAEAIRAREAGR